MATSLLRTRERILQRIGRYAGLDSAGFERSKAGTRANLEARILIVILEAIRQADYSDDGLISKLWKAAAEFGPRGYANLPA